MIRQIYIDKNTTNDERLSIKDTLVNNIKEYIMEHTKHPSGKLADSIRGHVMNNYIYIQSDKKHAEAVNSGTKPYIMYHLLGKAIPIGNTIRVASLESFIEGGWRHPGTEGIHFVEHSVEKTSDDLGIKLKLVK